MLCWESSEKPSRWDIPTQGTYKSWGPKICPTTSPNLGFLGLIKDDHGQQVTKARALKKEEVHWQYKNKIIHK